MAVLRYMNFVFNTAVSESVVHSPVATEQKKLLELLELLAPILR